jgi:DNA-directed RNA polymerase II subunit RPB1
VWEIYETLGIEAARNFLVEEFGNVISSDGTFVNESHALLLVDRMTYSGTIISVSRYGMKKENCGPIAKASFEESLDNFTKAGAFSEKENTNGVSASIMLGKLARFGTGICDVLVDVDQLSGMKPILAKKVSERSSR